MPVAEKTSVASPPVVTMEPQFAELPSTTGAGQGMSADTETVLAPKLTVQAGTAA